MKLLFTDKFWNIKTLNPYLPKDKYLSLIVWAFVLISSAILLCASPLTSIAAETPITLILPLKINIPDADESLTKNIDSALKKALGSSSSRSRAFKMLTRDSAENIFNYEASWPPAFETLMEFGTKTAPDLDYIAAGSLTKFGDTVSIDIKVFDLLDPTSPTFYYLDGQKLENIEK
ncbi:MAG: hypothetical protein JRF02_02955 [Deltaproteobacteria bacterium]|jgi:hypothetical protein|nr:hypothetical protein [Deltaproteobacteria bacterium]